MASSLISKNTDSDPIEWLLEAWIEPKIDAVQIFSICSKNNNLIWKHVVFLLIGKNRKFVFYFIYIDGRYLDVASAMH